MVPSNFLAEIQHRKSAEHRERDNFLDDLELRGRVVRVAQTIRRHHEDVFKERDAPACKDGEIQWRPFVLQMPIPSERHENVREEKQCDWKPAGLDQVVHIM